MKRVSVWFSITAFALLWLAAPASAQQAEDIGDYRVHYSAMNTRMLPADVASAYGIQRSGSRAMLNVTVVSKAASDQEMGEAVHADVDASAVNLTGQQRNIALEQIEEEDAVYYIGTFRIANEETLTFNIEVRPRDSNQPPQSFSFQQQFFVEE